MGHPSPKNTIHTVGQTRRVWGEGQDVIFGLEISTKGWSRAHTWAVPRPTRRPRLIENIKKNGDEKYIFRKHLIESKYILMTGNRKISLTENKKILKTRLRTRKY